MDGQHCALKFATMNKMKLFISWMSTRMKNKTIQLSSEYLRTLSYEHFKDFRQAHMIRMTEVPTATTPSPTTPFPRYTSRSKTRPVFLSQHVDPFDEPHCGSPEEILLHLDELKSSPCSTFPSSSNPPELPKGRGS